jgi:hypothetical protein
MSQFDTENKDVKWVGPSEARAECPKLSQIVHQENDSLGRDGLGSSDGQGRLDPKAGEQKLTV